MTANHWARQRKPDGMIREMLTDGASMDEIIDELGVSKEHVKRVRTEWKKSKRNSGEEPPDGRRKNH